MTMEEDGYVKAIIEQMLKIFKEMQPVVDAKDKMQKELLVSKIATALCAVVEKSTNASKGVASVC